MQTKRFSKNDSGFTCVNCNEEVSALGYTSRNHCPKCLCSLHVDENPGDRMNECRGVMRPISVLPDAKKGYIIVHKCDKCGKIGRNKAAADDDVQLLIALTVNRDYTL